MAHIGKISEAAEALFVSAPALSTSISRLEKELGMHLFDRTNNRIIPLNDPFEPWSARLYWRKDRPLTEHEKAFRDFTKRFYQELH